MPPRIVATSSGEATARILHVSVRSLFWLRSGSQNQSSSKNSAWQWRVSISRTSDADTLVPDAAAA